MIRLIVCVSTGRRGRVNIWRTTQGFNQNLPRHIPLKPVRGLMIFRSKSLTFTEENPRIKNPQAHGTRIATVTESVKVGPENTSRFFGGQPISPVNRVNVVILAKGSTFLARTLLKPKGAADDKTEDLPSPLLPLGTVPQTVPLQILASNPASDSEWPIRRLRSSRPVFARTV